MTAILAALEVMDKEPTVLGLWATATVLGGGGYLLCRRLPWAAFPLVGVGILIAWSIYGEITDPFVGPAIRAEAGATYPIHALLAASLWTGLPLLGALQGRHRPKSVA